LFIRHVDCEISWEHMRNICNKIEIKNVIIIIIIIIIDSSTADCGT
jgi:hypothetical protein